MHAILRTTDLYYDRKAQQLQLFQASGPWLEYSDVEPFLGSGVSALVATTTSMRQSSLFYDWMRTEQPVLVAGPQGAGKNTLIRHALLKIQHEDALGGSKGKVSLAVLGCNAQSSPLWAV